MCPHGHGHLGHQHSQQLGVAPLRAPRKGQLPCSHNMLITRRKVPERPAATRSQTPRHLSRPARAGSPQQHSTRVRRQPPVQARPLATPPTPVALSSNDTDQDIQAAVNTCTTCQQLADVADQLLQLRCSVPGTATDAAPPTTESPTAQHLQPRHAIMLLQRLAELHPAASVLASVMLQPPYPFSTPFPTLARPAAQHPQPPQPYAPSNPPSSIPQDTAAPADAAQSTVQQSLQSDEFQQWGVGALSDPPSVHHTRPASPSTTTAAPQVLYRPVRLTTAQPSTDSQLPSATRQVHPPARHHAAAASGGAPGVGSARSSARSTHSGQSGQPGSGTDTDGADTDGHRTAEHAHQAVAQCRDRWVGGVMEAGLDSLTPSLITDLLGALAKLGYPHVPVTAEVCEYLALSGSLQLLADSAPSALVNVVWAMAKLGYDPGAEWISLFLRASRPTVSQWSAVDCAACCWALGRWRFRPAEPWLAMLYSRIGDVSRQLGPQGVVNVAWGLAMVKASVPRPVAETLMIEAQVVFETMTATGLATLCWALATLQHRPPAFWVETMMAAMVQKMPKIPQSARGLPYANLVWALTVWETVQPTQEWFEVYCRQVVRSLPVMSSRNLAVVLLGLADLGHSDPDIKWVSLALEEFHKRGVSEASPASLVAVLWAVSRLLRPPEAQGGSEARAWRPPRWWMVRYAHILQDISDAAAVAFPSLTPPDLVDVLVAVADLRFHPGQRWLNTHTAYCNVCVQEFSVYQMKLMNNALSVLSELSEADYLPKRGEVV